MGIRRAFRSLGPVLLAAGLGTSLVVVARGVLQPFELMVYDHWVRAQQNSGPDHRLLVVKVTEEDIQKLRQWPLSDQVLAQALEILQADDPRGIGVDIFRDLPVEPGHRILAKLLRTSTIITPVCKIRDSHSPGVAPPPGVPIDQVGFADLLLDQDGVVRRALLYVNPQPGKCQATNSLDLQLALSYLLGDHIQPQVSPQGYPQLGATVFVPLNGSAGAYSHLDSRGYQILIHYRSEQNVAPSITLADVLAHHFDPRLVRDRIVLVGVTASSIKDYFSTPYSAGQADHREMAGIMVHAQIVSQILSAVLNREPLVWYWPLGVQDLWILAWSVGGALLTWKLRHPLGWSLGVSGSLGSLTSISYLMFVQRGWIPLVSPAASLMLSSAALVLYLGFRGQQQQKQLALQAEEQAKAIALLQSMLHETRDQYPGSDSVTTSPESARVNQLLANRYRVCEVLAAGGFGQTYLAEDTQRPGKPRCVVKHLHPARQDPQFMQVARRLFNTEAEILERLGQHPCIPQLLAYFEENREFYLVEEFIPGHPLSQELKPGHKLSEKQVVEILRGVLSVLSFMHQRRIIHRDIKPGNIIRRQEDNRLVLIDFGAVKQMQPTAGEEGNTVVIGTPGYAAPEQMAGQPNLSSDIYALGIIGLQGLTGVAPKRLKTDPQTGEIQWRAMAPQVGLVLGQIIDKMVCYYFGNRYQSAAEVIQSLDRFFPK